MTCGGHVTLRSPSEAARTQCSERQARGNWTKGQYLFPAARELTEEPAAPRPTGYPAASQHCERVWCSAQRQAPPGEGGAFRYEGVQSGTAICANQEHIHCRVLWLRNRKGRGAAVAGPRPLEVVSRA